MPTAKFFSVPCPRLSVEKIAFKLSFILYPYVEKNPNRKAKTPYLGENLIIIKDPKRTRVCL